MNLPGFLVVVVVVVVVLVVEVVVVELVDVVDDGVVDKDFRESPSWPWPACLRETSSFS